MRQQGRAVAAAGRRRPKQARGGPWGRSWRRRGACARRGARRTPPGSWGRPPSRRVPEQAQACLLIVGQGSQAVATVLLLISMARGGFPRGWAGIPCW